MLLSFPVFDEDQTPNGIDNTVNWGEATQEHPTREAEGSGEHHEREVGLQKSIVVANLGMSANDAKRRVD